MQDPQLESYETHILNMANHIQDTGHFISYLNNRPDLKNYFICSKCQYSVCLTNNSKFFYEFLTLSPWKNIISTWKNVDINYISFNNAVGMLIYDKKVQGLARMKAFL